METSKKSIGDELNPLTSFAAAIHASLSAQQANDEAKKTRDTYGRGLEKPLASYDPDTQSWKMYGDTCLWGEPQCLEKLPPSGMTRNGVLYQQPVWVPITDVIGSSLLHTPTAKMNQMAPSMKSGWWPTPTAVTRPMEGNVRLYRAKVEAGEMTEEEAAAILGKSVWEAQGKIPAMWPTPTSRDHKDGQKPRVRNGKVQTDTLGRAVQMWPTPTTVDTFTPKTRSNPTLGDAARQSEQSTGKLNPTWVEWLMGFPTGWTDLEA